MHEHALGAAPTPVMPSTRHEVGVVLRTPGHEPRAAGGRRLRNLASARAGVCFRLRVIGSGDAAARMGAKDLAQRSEYHVRELCGSAVLH